MRSPADETRNQNRSCSGFTRPAACHGGGSWGFTRSAASGRSSPLLRKIFTNNGLLARWPIPATLLVLVRACARRGYNRSDASDRGLCFPAAPEDSGPDVLENSPLRRIVEASSAGNHARRERAERQPYVGTCSAAQNSMRDNAKRKYVRKQGCQELDTRLFVRRRHHLPARL